VYDHGLIEHSAIKEHIHHAVSSLVTIWCMKNPSHISYAFDNPVGLKIMVLYCKAHKNAVLSIQELVT
jgi:hypothetical protein